MKGKVSESDVTFGPTCRKMFMVVDVGRVALVFKVAGSHHHSKAAIGKVGHFIWHSCFVCLTLIV